MLTNQQISENYKQALNLASDLIRNKYGLSRSDVYNRENQILELAQTLVGSESIVILIQTRLFQPDYYRRVMDKTLDSIRHQFLPDVRKKQFLAIDALNMELPDTLLNYETLGDTSYCKLPGLSLKDILKQLSKANRIFLIQLLRNLGQQRRDEFLSSPGFGKAVLSDEKIRFLNDQIDLIRLYFPEGKLFDTRNLDTNMRLDEAVIIECFKNVYFGIDKRFPQNFLTKDGRKRAAVITRFLIEEILKTTPEHLLEEGDELFFIKHKLQGIYRLFNYSMNRALHNAYPDDVPPWLFSRSFENYWHHKKARAGAVRWLVENRLTISPENIYKTSISRNDFAKHGLSYLFNKYYNSVSKALLEAYPSLNPWEAGVVPFDFWTESNSTKAVRWMIKKAGWNEAGLPELYQKKILSRKTFSQFGLATLFERKFSKNIFRAIDCAYPGKFEPWQFGNVASEHWRERSHVIRALYWIAAKEGIKPLQLPEAVHSGYLNFGILKKYSIGKALLNLAGGKINDLFGLILQKNHGQALTEHHLINKLKTLIRKEKNTGILNFYLLYGFFAPNVQQNTDESILRYERMLRRIRLRNRLDI